MEGWGKLEYAQKEFQKIVHEAEVVITSQTQGVNRIKKKEKENLHNSNIQDIQEITNINTWV